MTQPTRLNFVTCRFGVPGSWMAGRHTGIDFRAPVGTKIHATRRGRVIHAGWGGSGPSYGNHVVIESRHRGRRIRHLYAHLSGTRVRRGQKVTAGQVIGRSGTTGNTNGPHLHYEERTRPFGYWNYRKPVLINWWPKRKKTRKKIRRRLGLR